MWDFGSQRVHKTYTYSQCRFWLLYVLVSVSVSNMFYTKLLLQVHFSFIIFFYFTINILYMTAIFICVPLYNLCVPLSVWLFVVVLCSFLFVYIIFAFRLQLLKKYTSIRINLISGGIEENVSFLLTGRVALFNKTKVCTHPSNCVNLSVCDILIYLLLHRIFFFYMMRTFNLHDSFLAVSVF